MSPNEPERVFPIKIDQNHCFRSNPVFFLPESTMDHNSFFRSKSTKTTLLGQNRPHPLFSVQKPGVSAKVNQTQFFGRNRPKTLFFLGQNPVFSQNQPDPFFFRPKSTKTSLFGRKPVFLAKIDQNQVVQSKSTKTIQNPSPSARSEYAVLIRVRVRGLHRGCSNSPRRPEEQLNVPSAGSNTLRKNTLLAQFSPFLWPARG